MRKLFGVAGVAAALLTVGGLTGTARADVASTGTFSVSTDNTWVVDGSAPSYAVDAACLPAVGYGSWGWTAAIAGTWIFSAPCTASDTESHTFTKTFTLPADAIVTSATLAFAVDNFGTASVNGTQLIDETGDGGWNFRDWQSADATAAVHGGTNTIALAQQNLPNSSDVGWGNPAGVVASLTGSYQTCDPAAPAITTNYLLRTVGLSASNAKFKTIVNAIAQNLANGKYGRNPCRDGYRAQVIADVNALL